MTEQKRPFSLEGKFTLIVCGIALAVLAMGIGIYALTASAWLSFLSAGIIGLPLGISVLRRFMLPVNRLIQALIGGVASLRDNDFSISIAKTRHDELGDLVDAYNDLGSVLRDERQNLFQRELLLDTVVQTTPLALVLTNARSAIVYSNTAARGLFSAGRRLEGKMFDEILSTVPEPMRDAATRMQDGLFTIEGDSQAETFHFSQREFVLNAQPHRLFLFKRMTREMNRQEVATWKKVIRVIGHELNNSLAPISSLAHSGAVVLEQQDRERLGEIFSTIEERASHLKAFIDGYARFAKLPEPQPEEVRWQSFIEPLGRTVSFSIEGELPAESGYFDPVQLEQVIINLLKNAHESGSPPADIVMTVVQNSMQQRVRISDRGSGMPEKVLKNALLPFYSTKQKGSGLGLPLCREIVEAHGGRLSLANRDDDGLSVEFVMPLRENGETSRRRV